MGLKYFFNIQAWFEFHEIAEHLFGIPQQVSFHL